MAKAPRAPRVEGTGETGGVDGAEAMAVYVRLWAVSTAARAISRAGRELVYNEAVVAGSALAFALPTSPVAALIGVGTRVYALLASMPHIHNSQVRASTSH